MIYGIRYRRGWFGKLILQVQVKYRWGWHSNLSLGWRDADITDLPNIQVQPLDFDPEAEPRPPRRPEETSVESCSSQ
jgi:hypothetical protein